MRVFGKITPGPGEVFAPDCKIKVHASLECHGHEARVVAFDETSRMLTLDVPDDLIGDINEFSVGSFSVGSRSRSAS